MAWLEGSALAEALRQNLALLKSQDGQVVLQSVEAFLARPAPASFDLVLLDPPFRQGWLEKLLPLLAENGWVAPGGAVYAEYESRRASPEAPSGWQLFRQKTTGQVGCCVFRVGTKNPA